VVHRAAGVSQVSDLRSADHFACGGAERGLRGVTVTVDGVSFTLTANADPNGHGVALFHRVR
jgi:hypothetical protein